MQASPECVEKFVESYIDAAMDWCLDGDGDQLSANNGESDIHLSTLAEMRADCVKFLEMIPRGLSEMVESNPGRFAAGFWLTRGSGGGEFEGGEQWILDYPSRNDIGQMTYRQLTKMADSFGIYYLKIGDDGVIRGVNHGVFVPG